MGLMMMVMMMMMLMMTMMMMMMVLVVVMVVMMMMMRCQSWLRFRAQPRHLPYIYIYEIGNIFNQHSIGGVEFMSYPTGIFLRAKLHISPRVQPTHD